MAVGGQRPKPVALKVVTGNPGKRALPRESPDPGGIEGRPRWLRGRPSAIWDEYAPRLDAMGVLRSADAHAFGAWCQLAALVEKGAHRMSPPQLAQWRALTNEFGLNPSARARMVSDAPKPPADPAEAYFAAAANSG